MEFYERVSGARLHAAYLRPGTLAGALPPAFLEDLLIFIGQFGSRINEIQELLSYNRI